MHLAVFPGSFDPMTFGHLDVVARGRRLFDELVVAVGRNPGKSHLFSPEERVEMAEVLVRELCESQPEGAPVRVLSYAGLTVDFARSVGASALLRGIRNLSDLQNEVQQAVTNREVAHLETAFVVAGQSFAYTSSSLIKQLAAMADDLDVLRPMVPELVIERLRAKRGDPLLESLREVE
ncbi:MAG: pantetheine-phosphate adenylyltransferase [Phycisphaerales bacterium]|nr:pantetheine-phosphate adenylyltransferase [Phycisphaerales bacterium]